MAENKPIRSPLGRAPLAGAQAMSQRGGPDYGASSSRIASLKMAGAKAQADALRALGSDALSAAKGWAAAKERELVRKESQTLELMKMQQAEDAAAAIALAKQREFGLDAAKHKATEDHRRWKQSHEEERLRFDTEKANQEAEAARYKENAATVRKVIGEIGDYWTKKLELADSDTDGTTDRVDPSTGRTVVGPTSKTLPKILGLLNTLEQPGALTDDLEKKAAYKESLAALKDHRKLTDDLNRVWENYSAEDPAFLAMVQPEELSESLSPAEFWERLLNRSPQTETSPEATSIDNPFAGLEKPAPDPVDPSASAAFKTTFPKKGEDVSFGGVSIAAVDSVIRQAEKYGWKPSVQRPVWGKASGPEWHAFLGDAVKASAYTLDQLKHSARQYAYLSAAGYALTDEAKKARADLANYDLSNVSPDIRKRVRIALLLLDARIAARKKAKPPAPRTVPPPPSRRQPTSQQQTVPEMVGSEGGQPEQLLNNIDLMGYEPLGD